MLYRFCPLKHVVERRRKQLLDGLKEQRSYWNLVEEVLDRTVARTRSGKFYGTVIKARLHNELLGYWCASSTAHHQRAITNTHIL
jgi:hypothetical protein